MAVFLIIAVIAVAAVAVVTYLNPTPKTASKATPVSTNNSNTPISKTPPKTPATQDPVQNTDTTPIPEEDVKAGPIEEAEVEEPVQQVEESPTEEIPEANATEANNAIEDGIHDAYFAKEIYEKTGSQQAMESPYSYTFNNNQDFSTKTKETVANEILDIISETLNGRNVFAKQEIILQALTANSYKGKNQNNGEGDTIQFHVFDMQPTLQKIDDAPLSGAVFVVAKSFNLVGEEATITIREKEELLVAQDAPLNVIEAKENDEDASELTELKATFDDDGIAKIEIKLRPKSDDDLKLWNEKINGGAEDGTHNYTASNTFTVDSEAEKNSIARTIESRSNEALSPNHNVKKEDISELLSVGSTYSVVENIPKYKKGSTTEYLWLKVEASGEEEDYNEDFLNEDDKYFTLGKSKAIIFPLIVKPENDTGKKWSTYYWAGAQGASQAAFNSNRSGGRKHAGRDLYTNPKETIVAIAPGKVLSISAFYAQTDQITVHHKTIDNREFIIRYGELDPQTIEVSVGDTVTQGQVLGVTGRLVGITVISGQTVYMIHFEHFTGDAGFSVSGSNTLSNGSAPFRRRSDLVDSIDILEEGYRNTFNETEEDNRVDPNTLSASEDVIEFIKDYEQFSAQAYNDAEGYCTIGYGHLIAYDRCENITLDAEFQNGITEARASELFNSRLAEFENGVKRDISVNLYQYEYDALVSLLFNAGESFLNTGGANNGDTQIKIKINNGDYAGGADEFSDVTNGGLAGLVTRRNAEINMFKNNIYDSTH